MFAIRINGTFLDLAPNAPLRYNLNNPLFDPDSIGRSFNFPLTVPLTARNRSVLGFPERLDHTRTSYEHGNAVLFLMHLPFEAVTATVTGSGAGFAEIVLQDVEPQLLDDLADIRVHEILETVPCRLDPPPARWRIVVSANPPNTYTVQVDGNGFGHTESGGAPAIPAVYGTLAGLINATFAGLAGSDTGGLYLDSEKMAEYFGGGQNTASPVVQVPPNGNLSVQDAVSVAGSRLAGFHNFHDDAVRNGRPDMCFPVCKWEGYYKGNVPRYRTNGQYLNYWFDGADNQNRPRPEPGWRFTFAPFVRLPYVFDRIAREVGLSGYGGSFYGRADTQNLVIVSNRNLDRVSADVFEGLEGYLNHHAAEIDLNRHVPEMTGREFLDAFLEIKQLYITLEEGVLHFHEKIGQLDAAPLDWSGKVGAAPAQGTVEKEGFRLVYEPDTNNTATVPGQLAGYVAGAGGTTVRTRYGTVCHTTETVPGRGSAKMPWLAQAGSGGEGGLGDTRFLPRLLHFYGLQATSFGTGYPYASHDGTDQAGTPVGGRTLDWADGPTGLYPQSWAGLPELGEGNQVTVEAALTVNDLLQLRQWEQARVRFHTPDGEVTGIVKQVRVTATQAGLGPSTVTIIKQQ